MKEELKIKVNELKKNNIIDSAEKVFSKFGIDNTTMDEISKEVGISKRTVYLYFTSKTAIFNAILFRANKRMYEYFSEEVQKKEFSSYEIKEKIRVFWNTLKKFKIEQNLYFKVISMYENQKSDMDSKDEYLEKGYEWSEKIYSIIKESILQSDAGFIKQNNIDETVLILWMTSISVLNTVDIKKIYLQDFFNINIEAFFETFFEYIVYPLINHEKEL